MQCKISKSIVYSAKTECWKMCLGREHSPDSCMETCTDGISILVFRGTFISTQTESLKMCLDR